MAIPVENEQLAAPKTRPRVWVVDDSALECELTRRALSTRFDVEVFVDGSALLEQLSTTLAPDVVVLDWHMPALSGLDICQFLRSQPSLRSIAVLVLTVHRETRAIVDALGAGADDFLAKPYVAAELIARVSALVRAKELRDHLARAEEAVRSVLEHLPDAVVCVDQRARVTFLNLEARRILQNGTDLTGSPVADILPTSISATLAHATNEPAALSDVVLGDRVFAPAVRSYDRSGAEEIVISLRDVTMERRYDGERSRLLKLERHARNEAQVANRAKDEFLAVVFHELRTPLNVMLGWTRMLRSGMIGSDEKREQALATIERSATAQTQLIEDILDVSRIITGKLSLSLGPVPLVPLIEGCLEAARPAASAKTVELRSHLDPNAGEVTGDRDRLQQVFANLLNNAVKFSKPGGRVGIAVRRADADTVEIDVTDEGEGIDQAFLPHIFERFRQFESSTTRAHGGLGLGLAIVQHIVELHGGTVSAASEGRGRGARFRVRLRNEGVLPRAEHKPESESSPTQRPGATDLAGTKLLLVEDEADTRDLMVVILEQLGAEVVAVSDAATALEKIRTWRPDLIVSDIGMPRENGYQLITKIRALPPAEGGRTPAVALTAYARVEDRARALAAGFDAHMTKPVDSIELGIVVGSALARSRNR